MKHLTRAEVARFRSCWRKRRYMDEVVARRVAKIKGMRVYRCETCKLFHLTKRP